MSDFGKRYAAAIAGLDEIEVAECWAAILYRRVPRSTNLAHAIAEITQLRDEAGKAAAARRDNAA